MFKKIYFKKHLFLFHKIKSKGFTLIELIVAIAILATLVLMTTAKIARYQDKVKSIVCNSNRVQLERSYFTYLASDERKHSELSFRNFLEFYNSETCPDKGIITFVEGKVRCSVHEEESDDTEDGNEETVPFL